MTTNVPPVVYTSAGFVAPAETAILAGVQADIQAAFAPVLPSGYVLNFTTNTGSNTNPTPQGELAESETAVLAMTYELLILYSNLVDPAFTYGRMQDAIGRIYYVSREAGEATVVTLNCIGIVGTNVAAGATIQDANGVLCTTLDGGTIPSGGSINLPFQAEVPGPVVLAAPFEIVSSIPGWDAVSLVSQVVGTTTESPQAFETRRSQSTAKNATGGGANITGAVLSVPGVVDCRVIINPSATSLSVLPSGQPIGITLLPNSIYAVALGGDSAPIAQAIFSKWMPGAPTNGSQSVVVVDTGSALALPYPQYTINFDYTSELAFIVDVSINNTNVPAGATASVQNAVAAAFVGQDVVGYNSMGSPIYGPRAKIGALFMASRLYPTVTQVLWPGSSLISIRIGSTSNPAATFLGFIDDGLGGGSYDATVGDVLTVTGVVSGVLQPGQNLFDPPGDVSPGTHIVSQTSGTPGGVGVYVVDVPQRVAAEEIFAVTAAYDEILPSSNQLPSILAANVNVTFTNPGTS